MIYPTRQYGMTFVELLFVAIVSAVAFFSGMTWLKGFVTGWQLDSTTRQLQHSLDLARNKAVFHRASVGVCALDENDCAGSQVDWSRGWMVFMDANNNGVLNDNEHLVKIFSPLAKNASIRWNRRSLRFNNLGQTADAGSFTVCPQDTENSHNGESKGSKVIISLAGRIRTEDTLSCS